MIGAKDLLRVLQGALIGGGAILPGISGGVLAVLFGVYQPLMELLTRPIQTIKKRWRLFLPLGIGCAPAVAPKFPANVCCATPACAAAANLARE